MTDPVPPERILLTGGSGRLGGELRRLLPGLAAPSRREMDITAPEQIAAALERYSVKVLLHGAAYTGVARAEDDRETCWRVNVDGTRNIVEAAITHGLFLVHISTDYVFDGSRGRYAEDDPRGPVCNYYALTKLVAEEIACFARPHLIIRTSFRPREWPYPVAFSDAYTSQDYVDIVAPDIALATQYCRDIPFRTLHIATERKSMYDLARRRRTDVRPGSRAHAGVSLPEDVSLDTSRWQDLRSRLLDGEGASSR